jgi:hypothetical protein
VPPCDGCGGPRSLTRCSTDATSDLWSEVKQQHSIAVCLVAAMAASVAEPCVIFCSPASTSDYVARSTWVLVGTVEKIEWHRDPELGVLEGIVGVATVKPIRRIKGKRRETFMVQTGSGEGCMHPMEKGAAHLLFLTESETGGEGMVVDSCSPSGPLTQPRVRDALRELSRSGR